MKLIFTTCSAVTLIKQSKTPLATIQAPVSRQTQDIRFNSTAGREKIRKRICVYAEGFVVLEAGGEVVGFINSGATDTVELSNEHFKESIGHDPEGRYFVIMSVVVHPASQHQ